MLLTNLGFIVTRGGGGMRPPYDARCYSMIIAEEPCSAPSRSNTMAYKLCPRKATRAALVRFALECLKVQYEQGHGLEGLLFRMTLGLGPAAIFAAPISPLGYMSRIREQHGVPSTPSSLRGDALNGYEERSPYAQFTRTSVRGNCDE